SLRSFPCRSSAEYSDQNEAEVERQGDGREDQGRPADAPGRRPRLFRHWKATSVDTLGGVSNVWCGAGDGTVHSTPFGLSQTLAEARSPLPRIAWITTQMKMSCDKPKPIAPMVATALKSANWVE